MWRELHGKWCSRCKPRAGALRLRGEASCSDEQAIGVPGRSGNQASFEKRIECRGEVSDHGVRLPGSSLSGFYVALMPLQPTPLILASNSPRRRELLTKAGYQFEVSPADEAVEAAVPMTPDVRDYPVVLALAKARAVCSRFSMGVVLAADTIAICDSEILGKPRDRSDARRMLELLSGREHDVLTAVVLVDCSSRTELSHLETTRLQMDELSDADLHRYLDSGLWQGKAGAFGYQDGWDWLHVIEGSEANVVGLPVERLPGLFAQLQQELSRIG